MTNHIALSEPQYKILSVFMDAALKVLPKKFNPDCCIAATRITIDVLSEFHFKVKPLSVVVNVINESSGYVVSLGNKDQEKRPGCWVGHLITMVNERCIVDLTLGQATRPQYGIRLHPILCGTDPSFCSGEREVILKINGSDIIYHPLPQDKTYLTAPDWQGNLERRREVGRAIKDLMRSK